MGRTFSQSLHQQEIFFDALQKCHDQGIDVTSLNGQNQSMAMLAEALRTGHPRNTTYLTSARGLDSDRARAHDIDHRRDPRGPADLAKDDREPSSDLVSFRTYLQKYLNSSEGSSTEEGRDRDFVKKMLSAINAYMAATEDEDTFRGRSMRDQQRHGMDWTEYERGATREGRDRIQRDRRLARRAADGAGVDTDAALSRRALCGFGPAVTDDAARLHRNVMQTFGGC